MGAFEQLFSPGRGEFEQRFSKNANARGGYPGGMLKLRFDWYIITGCSVCHKQIEEKWRQQIIMVAKPEFSNIEGIDLEVV